MVAKPPTQFPLVQTVTQRMEKIIDEFPNFYAYLLGGVVGIVLWSSFAKWRNGPVSILSIGIVTTSNCFITKPFLPVSSRRADYNVED
jgi:hypothetical protein